MTQADELLPEVIWAKRLPDGQMVSHNPHGPADPDAVKYIRADSTPHPDTAAVKAAVEKRAKAIIRTLSLTMGCTDQDEELIADAKRDAEALRAIGKGDGR